MTLREQIWTVLFAVLLTILVWLWAEGENRETRAFDAAIRFAAETERFIARATSIEGNVSLTSQLEVRLEVEGPNLVLDRITGRARNLTISIENPVDGESRDIDLRNVLQDHPLFVENGITVLSVTPATVTVIIDEIVRRRVPVTVDFPGVEIEEIQVRPSEVEIGMARQTWTYYDQAVGNEIVRLEIPQSRLSSIVPGEPTVIRDARLRLDERIEDEETLEFDPPNVTVELKLRRRLVELRMTVPVIVGKPPREEALYDVIVDPDFELVRDVIISGDADAIQRLENREIMVYALLHLSSDELERGITSKPIRWELAEGLQARLADSPPNALPEIPFAVIKKQPENP